MYDPPIILNDFKNVFVTIYRRVNRNSYLRRDSIDLLYKT